MGKKKVRWNTEKCNEFCESVGVEFLSEEYKGNKEKYKFRCKCGNIFERRWNGFYTKKNYSCNTCSLGYEIETWTLDKMKKVAKEKYNLILLSDEYINVDTPLKFKCSCGEIFTRSWANIQNRGDNLCNKCKGYTRWSTDKVKKIAKEEYGLTLLSDEYVDYHTPLDFLCSCGKNKVKKSWASIRYNKGGLCIECSDYSWTIDKIKKKAKEDYNLEILSTEYINAGERLEFRCSCGNIFERCWSGILDGRTLCLQCTKSESYGEIKIRKWLEDNDVLFKQEFIFDDCRNIKPLPFDFYLLDYNLLIEYDGEPHFQPKDFAGRGDRWAKKNFKEIKLRDNIKNTYCLRKDIPLIRIPYWDFDNIEEILEEALSNKDSAYFIA